MNQPIITSLLDTDLYKFSMQQAMLHLYPDADARFAFRCRGQDDLSPLLPALQEQIEMLADLSLSDDELDYLGSLRYLKRDYIHFMRLYRLNPKYIHTSIVDGQLHIEAEGPWLHITHFEIFILAIISELYSQMHYPKPDIDEGRKRLRNKIKTLKQAATTTDLSDFNFSDFGTRRRFSKAWQEEVITTLSAEIPHFVPGTSNVDLARRFNLIPVGTVAHEWMQAHQALGSRLIDSQQAALESWVKEYRGNLGIALTDVITMDAFIKDFDLYFSKLYDGLRHDSGDPILWGEKAIKMYQDQGIDPMTKRLVFSDSLNINRALELYEHFQQRIMVSFGIGTQLTNDLGYKPLNIVMKMVECNGQPVAKISDSPGKGLCQDESYVRYLKQVFNVKTPCI